MSPGRARLLNHPVRNQTTSLQILRYSKLGKSPMNGQVKGKNMETSSVNGGLSIAIRKLPRGLQWQHAASRHFQDTTLQKPWGSTTSTLIQFLGTCKSSERFYNHPHPIIVDPNLIQLLQKFPANKYQDAFLQLFGQPANTTGFPFPLPRDHLPKSNIR